MSDKTKKVLVGVGLILAGAAAMFGLDVAVFRPTTKEMEKVVETVTEKINIGGSVELSETDEPVQIEQPVNVLLDQPDVKTVEVVDGGEIKEFAGRGAFYRTDTFEHFVEDTLNKCVIEGNIFGAQCVSLAQAFWTNYAGYGLDLCGTGAARGMVACADNNARDKFVFSTNPADIIPGASVVFDGGTWGHVGFAAGYPNNGYVALYGENQGGKLCAEGGSQPNVINKSLKDFIGVFIPIDYIPQPEPEPEPAPEAPDTGATYLLYSPVAI